ncbi:hypothetical protein B566_EDAN006297 [Ephemera danica]|nr:hypothetical protein B566_EDAN006297 [Ephemera danica]
MSKRCQVGGCQNKSGKYLEGHRVYFYTLGVIKNRNPQRFNDFLLALKRRTPSDSPWFDSQVICSTHFADDAFEPGELSRVAHSSTQNVNPPRAPRLKDDAWPTINMSADEPTVQRGKKRKASSKTIANTKTKVTHTTDSLHIEARSSNSSGTEAPPTTSSANSTVPLVEEDDTIDQDHFDALNTTIASAPPDPNDLTYNPEEEEDVEESYDEEYEEDDLLQDTECTVTRMFTGDLEKNAFDVLFGRLLFEFESKIYAFLSDRHLGIAKLMREKYAGVIHEFDIWHLAKSFTKKLNPLCAKFEFLNEWRQSIINHIWWSAATCKENSELLVEKFKSILNHVRNIHSWDNGTLTHQCGHEPLPAATVKGRKWLGQKKRNYDSRQDYTVLMKLVNDNRFVNALKHASHFLHTGLLESYHNIRLMYTPKRIHYPCTGMVIRSILAVLDHNFNVSRTVVAKFSTYSKSSKKYVLKNKYAEKSNVWRENLMDKIINSVYHPEQFEVNPKVEELLFPFPIPTRIDSVEKPSMVDLMSKQFSRFKSK